MQVISEMYKSVLEIKVKYQILVLYLLCGRALLEMVEHRIVFPNAKLIKSLEMQYQNGIFYFSRGNMSVTFVSYVTYLLSIRYNFKNDKINVSACFKNIKKA